MSGDTANPEIDMYAFGTRIYTTGTLLNRVKAERKTIEENGAWYADVPLDLSDEEANALLARLNDDGAAVEYRGQFASDEEWMQHLDENAAG